MLMYTAVADHKNIPKEETLKAMSDDHPPPDKTRRSPRSTENEPLTCTVSEHKFSVLSIRKRMAL